MNDPIYSVAELAEKLLETSRDYLRHFDPQAPLEVAVIRLELSGPSLNLIFAQQGDQSPSLTLSLQSIPSAVTLTDAAAAAQERAGRGWPFQGGGA